MTTTNAIQKLAAEARSHFHTIKRDGEEIWTLKDGRPEWVKDLVFAAHDSGGMLPDDWRYAFVVEALDALEEADYPDDAELEADIYNSDLLRWLSSRADRAGYCDDAREEWGGEPGSLIDQVMLGQAYEKREVLDSVRSFLAERAEETEDEGDEEDGD